MSAISRVNERDTLTIASAGTTSGALWIGEFTTGSFQLPATFTGVAITFLVSNDNTTFVQAQTSAGAAISVTVSQGHAYAIPSDVMTFGWMKLVSGSSEGASRAILVNLKG